MQLHASVSSATHPAQAFKPCWAAAPQSRLSSHSAGLRLITHRSVRRRSSSGSSTREQDLQMHCRVWQLQSPTHVRH